MSKRKLTKDPAASSAGIPSQILQTSSPPVIEDNGVESKLEKVFSTYSLDNKILDFVIPPSNFYTDLKSCTLVLQGALKKIVTDAGGVVTPDAAPCNNFIASAFSAIEVFVNDVSVTKHTNFYPYLSYISRITGDTTRSAEALSAQFFNDDVSDLRTVANVGWWARKEASKEEKIFSVSGPLFAGVFLDSDLWLPPGNQIRVRLTQNDPNFCIDSATLGTGKTLNYNFHLSQCHLLVKRVNVADGIYRRHEALESKNSKFFFPFYDRKIISYSLATGETSSTSEILSANSIPTKVVVGLVDAKAFFGHAEKSPFVFKPYNLAEASLSLNGESLITKAIDFDLDSQNFLYAYNEFDLAEPRRKFSITPKKFLRDTFLVTFNLNSSSIRNFCKSKTGALRCHLKFSKPLEQNLMVVCFLKSQSLMILSGQRNVEITDL